MKNCTECVHAEWKRTASGKLHPSGDGRCTKQIVIPPLPGAFGWGYAWSSKSGRIPEPIGGEINRRQELKEHCPYWARG
jgi:hypothetical protein